MSDELKHECGVALLRLRKPLNAYPEHYGLQQMALLLEKQHNRGQDGAGIAALKIEARPGEPYYQIEKSADRNPLANVLEQVWESPFPGDVFLGHLRYGTFGNQSVDACHPLLKYSVCRNRTLLLAGNFNLTNSSALFEQLTRMGHHLPNRQDTTILLHQIGHELEKALDAGNPFESDLSVLLSRAAISWDGGFLICGIFGDGTAFALRDPSGIRPGFYYVDDEVAVVASERPPIQTGFNVKSHDVKEIPPGSLLMISSDGKTVEERPCLIPREIRRCVFERIYFSRGNDCDIQQERRLMGKHLVPQILDAIDQDYDNTFFSYIPNTAQISYHGVLDELLHKRNFRFGQVVFKDAKFRTFIADANRRKALDMHIYDIVYGLIRPKQDNLVLLDDSIVRGTTLRNLILKIVDRLEPKKIVLVSAAPPICYPDCYGIDMASMGELIAFQAVISLLRKTGQESLLHECVGCAREDLLKPDTAMRNRVAPLYAAFTFDELCHEIGLLLTPEGLKAKVTVVFQRLGNLRLCCPEHTGDWYFSGNYPTPGGNRVVNQALVNYCDKINKRAY
ncbi:MAG: amidophosphoribosyltransferase [bacterium]